MALEQDWRILCNVCIRHVESNSLGDEEARLDLFTRRHEMIARYTVFTQRIATELRLLHVSPDQVPRCPYL